MECYTYCCYSHIAATLPKFSIYGTLNEHYGTMEHTYL